MKKWLKYLLLAFGLVLLLILTGYSWLTRSEAGTRWILGFAESDEKPLIAFDNINGSINSGIHIGKIRYSDTGTKVSINNLKTQIDYHLFPLTLEIKTLRINNIEILLAETDAEALADAEAEIKTNLSLPLDVDLQNLDITYLLYQDFDLQLEAKNTRAALQIGEVLSLKALKTELAFRAADTAPATNTGMDQALAVKIKLSGLTELQAPWKHQLELELVPVIDPASPDPYLQLLNGDTIRLASSGNTQHLQLDLSSSGDINLEFNAVLRDLLEEVNWQVRLQSEQLVLPLADESSIELQQLLINSSGNISHWQLEGNSHLIFSGSQAENINGQWQLSATGGPQNIEIARLALNGEIGNFDFHGSINPDSFAIDGELDWKKLKAGVFVPDWPLELSSSGHTRLVYQDDEISISGLLAVIDNTPTRLEGDINMLANAIDATLNWQNLSWPLASAAADFESSSGNMAINGSLSEYQLSGQFNLAGADIPTGVYQLDGIGTETGLQLQRLNSRILEGELNISGDIQWQPDLRTNIKINGNSINPGNYWPDYNGNIGVDMDLQWQAGTEPKDERINIQLHQLDGQLRDYPLQASGNIQMLDGNDLDMDIKASSGDALLELKGRTGLSDPLAGNAVFKIMIPDLAQLISDTTGQINAHGQLQQSPDGRHLLVSLQAGNISSAGSSLDMLELEIDTLIPVNSSQSLQLVAQIDAARINLAALDLPIESIKFTAEKPVTAGQEHLLSLNVNADENTLDTSLKANINMEQGSFSLAGMLQSINIFTPVTGKITLQEPARIEYADMQLLLTPACFRQQPDKLNAEICLERQAAEDNKQIASRLKLDDFPLAWISPFFASDLTMSQSLSGTVTVNGDQSLSSIQSVDGSIIMSPGIIASVDTTAGSLETNQGLFAFKLDPGNQLKGLFDLPFKVGTGLKLEFNIDHTTDLEAANFTGKLDIVLDDLVALKWLAPGLDDLSGTFETHLQAQGKLVEPQFEGLIDINNVGLVYTPLGLEISKLNLEGKLASGANSNLQGSFIAGEGEGQINVGINNSSEQSTLKFSITGTDLQLLNAPNLKLKASLDLSALMSNNQLALNGSIDIPSALITPPPGMISSTPVSEDVVVSGLDIKEVTQKKELPLDINGTVRVTLGDDVRFVMDIVKTRLVGGVELMFEGNSGIPTATGSIQLVDGFFHQYGQNLEFLDSEIRFDGKEVSNPLLDIYAVRRIFADPEVEFAGINIAGRPDAIRMKLYTDPETDQESAVAYLATGSNFDHGNGVGALNIGTYIYPKLFVSYGIGLFDTGNEVSARYELTGNWAIQGTSAESGSGVDVLYSIDR